MTLIGDLFGRSPIRPMQEHIRVAVTCAQQVLPLFEALSVGDRDKIKACRSKIDELEHKADHIKNEIRSHLPKRLFMAMERRDMLEILDAQDSIADVAQDIAELADLRGMTLPSALKEVMLEFVQRVIVTCEQAEKVINQLDELVETGFGNREVTLVEDMISVLNRYESETDKLEEKALRILFAEEDKLGVSTFFWYQIIGWVGDLADYAERVGNRLRLLIAN